MAKRKKSIPLPVRVGPMKPTVVEITSKGEDALYTATLSRMHKAMLEAAQIKPPLSIQALVRRTRTIRSVAFDERYLCNELADMQREGLVKIHQ